jgi:hypothetical protein
MEYICFLKQKCNDHFKLNTIQENQSLLDQALIRRTKLTTTAANKKKQSIVGPNLSSYGPEPLLLIAAARQ